MNPSDQSPVDNQPNQNINPSPEVGTPNPVVPQPVSGDPLATPPKKSKKGDAPINIDIFLPLKP